MIGGTASYTLMQSFQGLQKCFPYHGVSSRSVVHRKGACAVLMIDRVSVGVQHVHPYHVNVAGIVEFLSLEDVDSVPKPEAIICMVLCRSNVTVVQKDQ